MVSTSSMDRNTTYVYVRKQGHTYYEENKFHACYKITLKEALEQGYVPSKENVNIKIYPTKKRKESND